MMKFGGILAAMAIICMTIIGCGDSSQPVNSSGNDLGSIEARLAVPSDAEINSAKIMVFVSGTDDNPVYIHNIEQDWEESSVTWNNFADAFDIAAFDTVLFQVAGWYSIDITAPVEGWFDGPLTNFGFLLRSEETDTAHTFLSSLDAISNQPFIEVCYTIHEGQECDTFPVIADATILMAAPDDNFGTDPDLIIGSTLDTDSTYRSLMKFSFPVEIRYVSIGDYVWFDENADGIQDETELGMADVTVSLYDCEDNLIAETMTDADGHYLFEELLAGDYYLIFTAPEDHVFSPMAIGSDAALDSDVDPENGKTSCLAILPGVENADIDAGLYLALGTIGDMVWDDTDMNGIFDDGETGLAGIAVNLYSCDGELIESMVTDENGLYKFEMVSPGEYYLEFVTPFGYIFTYQDMGDDDELDSDVDRYQKRTDCFIIEPGDELLLWDAGLFAFDGCTYGKGYWKNHGGFGPKADEITKLLPVWLGTDDGDNSLAITDAQIAVDILTQHVYGHPSNGLTKLYAHLLTARLNLVNFANPEDIIEMIGDIDEFLADYDYTEWESFDNDQKHMINQWKDALEDYNEGDTGPGHCDDDDEEEDDDIDDGDDE